MRQMKSRHWGLAGLVLWASGAMAADGVSDLDLDSLHIESHGFVSFGYLKSWGNNWLGETLDGTSEFYEAAANVIARPLDRLRIGAQLFTRDLGNYGNGNVELDWAYADWRFADAFGVQVGRVKLPLGLYSDALDLDAARPSVFLPRCFVYPLRSRDILMATDGGKVYGTSGPFDWAATLGNRQFSNDSDFANALIFLSRQLSQVTDIDTDYSASGMLHWRTPIPGLEAQLCGATVQGLNVEGISLTGTAAVEIRLPEWYIGFGGLIYEMGDFTWSAEYARQHAPRHVIITPFNGGPVREIDNVIREEDAYLSLTWHARRWLDLYAAVEGLWDDPTNLRGAPYSENAVAAFAVMPTRHWSFKVEYRFMHGTKDIDANLNPDGIADHTQVLALKTTVDF